MMLFGMPFSNREDMVLVEATAKSWYVVHSETLEIIEIIQRKEINSIHGRDIWKRVYSERNSAPEEDNT